VLSLLIRLCTVGVLAWLAATDIRDRHLPNKGVVAVAVLFFADALVMGSSLSAVAWHAAAAITAGALCVALYMTKMLGGGDVKLVTAIGLWAGGNTLVAMLMLVAIVGLLMALLGLATRRLDPTSCFGPMRTLALLSCERGVPYGVALATGGSAAVLLPVLPFIIKH
jgi:prepilin peptidase CpaA